MVNLDVEIEISIAELSGTDLRFANLSGINLRDADLSNVQISSTKISNASLSLHPLTQLGYQLTIKSGSFHGRCWSLGNFNFSLWVPLLNMRAHPYQYFQDFST
ncbi:MAG: pentapeptide repeat-containing protein [Leptolyngbya sp. SIOISBB]|nr:pentapeptide repeat-containing protein [Leptolyngbya sp. SIOISBB]